VLLKTTPPQRLPGSPRMRAPERLAEARGRRTRWQRQLTLVGRRACRGRHARLGVQGWRPQLLALLGRRPRPDGRRAVRARALARVGLPARARRAGAAQREFGAALYGAHMVRVRAHQHTSAQDHTSQHPVCFRPR